MDPENDRSPEAGLVPVESLELTLEELCRACAVRTEYVVELVEEGVLVPEGPEPQRWRFTYTHVRRARVASHLQRDLGVNLAGAALAVELLEQIEALRARLQALGGD